MTDMIKPGRRLSTYLRRLVNNNRHGADRCILCLAPAAPERLCQGCDADLPRLRTACGTCGLPLAFPAPRCGRCQQRLPAFDQVQTALVYRYPVQTMIGRFKYQGEKAMAWPLIDMLVEKLHGTGGPWPDVLLPCPIHPRRYRSRGFNQAAVIAERLGAELGIAVNYQLCQRPQAMPPQTGLSRAERLKNLQKAFVIRGIPPPRVAIVDDVITTGATAEQLALVLKAAGAEQVLVWALARTPLP